MPGWTAYRISAERAGGRSFEMLVGLFDADRGSVMRELDRLAQEGVLTLYDMQVSEETHAATLFDYRNAFHVFVTTNP